MKKQIKNTLPVSTNTSIVEARGVNDESGLAQYIQSIQKYPILTAEQEYEYATQWTKHQDSVAAEKLVASHLRLVVSVAYDFKNYGVPVADLIASGNMGLMQALQKFDPERGFRFSTYAMFWIKAEIYETILNNWSIVKIGTSANQKRVFFNLSRARRALGIMDNTLNNEQTKQIADFLNVSESDVSRMAQRIGARDVSLNSPAHNDQDAHDILSNLSDEKTFCRAPGDSDVRYSLVSKLLASHAELPCSLGRYDEFMKSLTLFGCHCAPVRPVRLPGYNHSP